MLVRQPLELPEPNAPSLPPRLIDRVLDVFLATRGQATPMNYLECLCLMVLSEWMHRCLAAVDIVFSKPPALPYLIALVHRCARVQPFSRSVLCRFRHLSTLLLSVRA